MKKYYKFFDFALLISVALLIIFQSDYTLLMIFVLGFFNILIGWFLKDSIGKDANIYFYGGLFIVSIAFLGSFIAGIIDLQTIEIYEQMYSNDSELC